MHLLIAENVRATAAYPRRTGGGETRSMRPSAEEGKSDKVGRCHGHVNVKVNVAPECDFLGTISAASAKKF